MSVALTYGTGRLPRKVEDAEALLAQFAAADEGRGALYYDLPPVMPDALRPEDLGVTLLMNSRADGRSFQTLVREAGAIDLTQFPNVPLEETDEQERRQVADLIAGVAALRAFGASLATKLLHKKRPALIPILDNQAVFGAYMNAAWPIERSKTETVKDKGTIREALDWIAGDLTHPSNQQAWRELGTIRPRWSRVEIWDAVWWAFFRASEPLGPTR